MRYDFFSRCEGKNFSKDNHQSLTLEIDTPQTDPLGRLAAALEYAHANGLGKGSYRSGCFQVQADDGIYTQLDDVRFNLATPQGRSRVQFKTWEELEAEDLAAAGA